MTRIPLDQLKPGQGGVVAELLTNHPARLDRLGALGLVPGSWVVVQQTRPALVFRTGATEVTIDREIAREILVEPAEDGMAGGPAR